MGATINVGDTEALTNDSIEILKAKEQLDELRERYEEVKNKLAGWNSPTKESAFASLDEMNNKLGNLGEIVESYGKVGIQAAGVTEAAEADVKALNEKFTNYIS